MNKELILILHELNSWHKYKHVLCEEWDCRNITDLYCENCILAYPEQGKYNKQIFLVVKYE